MNRSVALSTASAAQQTIDARPGIRLWNVRQIRTFLRYGSLYHVPLTAEVITPLASRYAEKHANTRPRMLQVGGST